MTRLTLTQWALLSIGWIAGHRLTWNIVGLLITTTSIVGIWAAILKL